MVAKTVGNMGDGEAVCIREGKSSELSKLGKWVVGI
jgi:hypothetical protein